MFGSATAPLLVLVVSGGRLKIGAGHPSMRLCPAPAVDRRDSPTVRDRAAGVRPGSREEDKAGRFHRRFDEQLVTSQSVGGRAGSM